MNKLKQNITNIKGIGEETANALNEMGIYTIEQLIEYFPYRYEDYRLRDMNEIKHGERITIEGKVHSEPSLTFYGKKKSRLQFRIFVNHLLIKVVFFNQPYLKKQFSIGDVVTITGKWDQHRQTITGSILKTGQIGHQQELRPIYSVKGNVTVKGIARLIALALNQFGELILEILPEEMISSYKLMSRKDAVKNFHIPKSREHLKHARRRMVYEEFLLFQLKMQAMRKFEREHRGGNIHTFSEETINQFISSLPFPLTNAQTRVVQEILDDMASPYRMNRLLQGDVGSGKTVVAAIALFATIKAGNQGALMVPTEILAEQHALSLMDLLASHGLNVALLTSSVKGKKRKDLLKQLQDGVIDVIVGTHALIQDEVNFNKLGLVITDEQHRFGVEQRRILREKGESPDVLFMTATPIPRTLAITVFGDMDVSVIDEMPAGRKLVKTYWVNHTMLERILAFILKEINKGHQAYVICPLIEESEKLDVQNAIDVYTMLVQFFSSKIKIGLMHGRLSSGEKEEVMKKFSENDYQILVSTTVVEVGVNVPNATVMVIYDAERFGLSQLHQLRGRVGRGNDQSYCILIADPKTDVGKERMTIMTETNDGFELSQKDLELRGPGDFFGKKQSGLPEFKIADMVHDFKTLEVARNDAARLISSSSFWQDEQYRLLRSYLNETGVLNGEKLD
ncbi:ATP-dependent DNA helicase RecG [Calidifontibacillus oryziterrae]|uniref:ATP-dependent DNA helicase RecG n=1 Tax=Calidifontibacillus oryziterrae TaxID=1191699 RepID=UPI0002FA0770|nr:ATP-dependent DNA helicase RecG [Calidifontibacillus oryziterrae]